MRTGPPSRATTRSTPCASPRSSPVSATGRSDRRHEPRRAERRPPPWVKADQHRPSAHGRPPGSADVRAGAKLRGGGTTAPGRRMTSSEREHRPRRPHHHALPAGYGANQIDELPRSTRAPTPRPRITRAPTTSPSSARDGPAGSRNRPSGSSLHGFAGRARGILIRSPAHRRHAVVGKASSIGRSRKRLWSGPGRTFAVIELAVPPRVRRSRYCAVNSTRTFRLVWSEERATLLVRPDAGPARTAYLSWAYRPLGRLQPFPDGPVYDAMVKELHGASRSWV